MISSKKGRVLVILLIFACINSNAFDFSFNGIGYNIIEENGQKVAQVTQSSYLPDYAGDVVIPSEVSYEGTTYKVTSIDWYAFGDCEGLTSISLPNSVTVILGEAFWGCSGLTTLTLPNSVTTIKDEAFSSCSNLTSVFIPASVTSLYRNVFSNCPALTSIKVDASNPVYDSRNNCNAIIDKAEKEIVTGCVSTVIPAGVTSIGVAAFRGCTNLSHIDFPGDLSIINFDAFYGCTGLRSVDFPSTLWHIGDDAFNGCVSLTSLYIPKRTTSIGDGAFSGCSGLETMVVDEENYQYDSRNNCNAIIETKKNRLMIGCKSTVIPNDVVRIEKNAFKNCVGLTSIVIPNSVTDIGYSAFENCQNLQNVNIPNGITWVKSGVFENCSNLVSILIPNGVEAIDAMAFAGCTSLRSIFIPRSVVDIEPRVFAGCTNLVLIDIDEGNTIYDSRNECNAIIETATNSLISGCKNTRIPDGITTIEESAFQSISTLSAIDIPNSVTNIESYAFEECEGLTSIIFPNSVTSIGSNAFYGCSNLESVVLSSNITSLQNSLFSGCKNLSSISIPNSVIDIGGSVFSGCENLHDVTLPDNLQTIGTYAFYGCANLTNIELPSSIISIKYCAFDKCYNLRSIKLPSSVTTIGGYAFDKCDNLTSVICEVETPIFIDERVFSNCANATLYVPAGSVSVYSNAVGWRNFKEITSIKDMCVVTYNDPENGLLFVTQNGAEIGSGTQLEENSTIKVSVRPDTGYELESLTINGEPIENNSSINVAGSIHITATFKEALSSTYTITYNEPENGVVIVAVDGNEIESGASVSKNSLLTILVIAYTDYALENLTVNGREISNNSSIPVTESMDISVSIVPEDALAVSSINADKSKNVFYDLSGHRVIHPKKGIYILNGKKVVVK